jgi:hypothetical protein
VAVTLTLRPRDTFGNTTHFVNAGAERKCMPQSLEIIGGGALSSVSSLRKLAEALPPDLSPATLDNNVNGT